MCGRITKVMEEVGRTRLKLCSDLKQLYACFMIEM